MPLTFLIRSSGMASGIGGSSSSRAVRTVASPPATCPPTACPPVAASHRLPTFAFVMGRDGGLELVIRGEHPWLVSSRQAVPVLPRWRPHIGSPGTFGIWLGMARPGGLPVSDLPPVQCLVVDAPDATASIHHQLHLAGHAPAPVCRSLLESVSVCGSTPLIACWACSTRAATSGHRPDGHPPKSGTELTEVHLKASLTAAIVMRSL